MSSEIANKRTVQQRACVFVLASRFEGATRIVADGTLFPSGMAVIDWRNSDGTEMIASLDALYEKYGDDPFVLWSQMDGTVSEAEPPQLIESQ